MFEGLALVSASQVPPEPFTDATYLGRSLMRIPESLRPPLNIAFANVGPRAMGLGEIFNKALDATDAQTNLVFLHDDVYLNDWFFAQRVREALGHFDVVGVVGSVNPDLTQPSWGLRFDKDLNATGWQPGLQRSGAVNHFDYACPKLSVYGPTPLPCRLLDGLFIAINTAAVKKSGVRFDSRFRFHCYDIDFCRSATERGLRIGTWPISLTHNSGGSYGSDAFKQAARAYLKKWPAGGSSAAG
jgi:GT2 family glycosyltransferase